jgi:hypothetical protein
MTVLNHWGFRTIKVLDPNNICCSGKGYKVRKLKYILSQIYEKLYISALHNNVIFSPSERPGCMLNKYMAVLVTEQWHMVA